MRLKDKVAIITGGASGIGQATAELFGEERAKVVVADIEGQAGETTAQKIRDQHGSARFIHADISKEDDARKVSAGAVKIFRRIDILVNNAATALSAASWACSAKGLAVSITASKVLSPQAAIRSSGQFTSVPGGISPMQTHAPRLANFCASSHRARRTLGLVAAFASKRIMA